MSETKANKSTAIPPYNCFRCGYKMTATSEAYGDRTPSAGDASMCLMCGHIMVFNEDLTVREPTAEENAQIRSDPDIIQADIVRAGVVSKKKSDK